MTNYGIKVTYISTSAWKYLCYISHLWGLCNLENEAYDTNLWTYVIKEYAQEMQLICIHFKYKLYLLPTLSAVK
jgi:hypothetical protein